MRPTHRSSRSVFSAISIAVATASFAPPLLAVDNSGTGTNGTNGANGQIVNMTA